MCGQTFYRKQYRSGRWEEIERFIRRPTCDDPECKADYRSRLGLMHTRLVSDIEQAWLSGFYSRLIGVRYKK